MEVLQKKKEQIVSQFGALQAVQNESSDTSIQLKTFTPDCHDFHEKNLPDAMLTTQWFNI